MAGVGFVSPLLSLPYPFPNFLSSCCPTSNLNFCFLFADPSSLRLRPVCSPLLAPNCRRCPPTTAPWLPTCACPSFKMHFLGTLANFENSQKGNLRVLGGVAQ